VRKRSLPNSSVPKQDNLLRQFLVERVATHPGRSFALACKRSSLSIDILPFSSHGRGLVGPNGIQPASRYI
jgi:hypothetical protein